MKYSSWSSSVRIIVVIIYVVFAWDARCAFSFDDGYLRGPGMDCDTLAVRPGLECDDIGVSLFRGCDLLGLSLR